MLITGDKGKCCIFKGQRIPRNNSHNKGKKYDSTINAEYVLKQAITKERVMHLKCKASQEIIPETNNNATINSKYVLK